MMCFSVYQLAMAATNLYALYCCFKGLIACAQQLVQAELLYPKQLEHMTQ